MMDNDVPSIDAAATPAPCVRDHCLGTATPQRLDQNEPRDGYTIGLTPEEYRRKYGCSPRYELLRWQCNSCAAIWFSYLFQHDGRLETIRHVGRASDSTRPPHCHRAESYSGSMSGHTSNRPSISTSIMSANSSADPSPIQPHDMPFGQHDPFTNPYDQPSIDTGRLQGDEPTVMTIEPLTGIDLLNWQFEGKIDVGDKNCTLPASGGGDIYFDNIDVHNHVNTPLSVSSHAGPGLSELPVHMRGQQLTMSQDPSASFTAQQQQQQQQQQQGYGLPPHKRGDNFDPVAYQYSREHGVCEFHRRQKRKCRCNIARRKKRQFDETEQQQ